MGKSAGLGSVGVSVVLGADVGFGGVVVGVGGVLVSLDGVLVSELVVAGLVVVGGFVVGGGCVLVVLGCLAMCFVCHGVLLCSGVAGGGAMLGREVFHRRDDGVN